MRAIVLRRVLYIDVYKVFEEISSENSSFSEVSDVILARRSTRLLTVMLLPILLPNVIQKTS
jgi:predicted CopG family antitoxin